MRYFLLVSVDQPELGEWCELAEFLLSEKEADIKKEFENAIVDGDYPYVATGTISAEGVATIEVTHHKE